jgi:hypothetical protein
LLAAHLLNSRETSATAGSSTSTRPNVNEMDRKWLQQSNTQSDFQTESEKYEA